MMRISTCAAALTLCAATPVLAEMTIEHAQGQVTLEGMPETVLVFDVASLDTLHALGVEVTAAPGGLLPDHLRQYGSDIGTVFEPDYEAVFAHAPDLIIIGGRSAPKYPDLTRIAATIDLTIDREGYIENVRHNVELLGRIFDKEAEAAEQIAALDAEITALNELSVEAGTALALITTGGRVSAHGPGSRFGVIYDEYGFAPAATGLDTSTHGQSISHEFILETNPDWLFIVDRDAAIGREGQAAAQVFDNELIHQTTAWQQGQVVYLDAQSWYVIAGGIGGLRSGIAQIHEALSTR